MVYFEEVRQHLDAAHAYGGFITHSTAWCEHRHITYQDIPVGTIKKHATGKGNAGKTKFVVAMHAMGHPVTDDNEADALALLHWAIEAQGRPEYENTNASLPLPFGAPAAPVARPGYH